MIVECPGCQLRYDVTGRPAGTQARCRCGSVFTLPEPPTTAKTIDCPQCGAKVAPTNHQCEFCSTQLLVKACPRCFCKVFHGAKFCNSCGAEIAVAAKADLDGNATPLACPRCDGQALVGALVGDVLMDECPGCAGIWLDQAAFERIVDERRKVTVDAVHGRQPSKELKATPQPAGKMYVKCPECEQVMNRENFGLCSGVIIDVCGSHGTWFDAQELPKIVDFVMSGGLEKAARIGADRRRERERRERVQKQAVAVEAAKQYQSQKGRRKAAGAEVLLDLIGGVFSLFD